jgi:hypothetical protein
MRHNDIINWKDYCAIEIAKALIIAGSDLQLTDLSKNDNGSTSLSATAYSIAEAMFEEREKDKHNPIHDK